MDSEDSQTNFHENRRLLCFLYPRCPVVYNGDPFIGITWGTWRMCHCNNSRTCIHSCYCSCSEGSAECSMAFCRKIFRGTEPLYHGIGSFLFSGIWLSICSLQEMQWMDCCYLNSAEYFHGPFEVTDEDHLYILMMSRGRNRMMDARVLTFLEKYGKKYEVIDADKLGMEAIDDSCVEYFTPMLFYTMTTVYRTALQDKRRHPLDMRRYMGVVEY